MENKTVIKIVYHILALHFMFLKTTQMIVLKI